VFGLGCLNTYFLVNRGKSDCVASAVVSIRRVSVDPNEIDAIILSHLHADHFGGLPSFILNDRLVSGRIRPLVIAGPKKLPGRLGALMEAQFPGSSAVERKFQIELIELIPDVENKIGLDGSNCNDIRR
jgi:ribonuclease BN (tRNA processing enzyme)